MASIPATQRAYTLRLRGTTKDDQSWRDALWATHEAVNKGARAFGDWLLTLRGALDHTLVDEPIARPKKKGKEQPPRSPTDEEKRDRRIVLALSWLSVESQHGAPEHRVSTGETLKALRQVLRSRGVEAPEIRVWEEDCERTLLAAIRGDACWVNRSMAFDDFCTGCDKSAAREDARKVIWHLFGNDYLTLPRKREAKSNKSRDEGALAKTESEEELAEEKRSAAIQSGRGAGQRTRHLFSHVLGSKADSKGFGKQSAMQLRQWWREKLTIQVAECGIPLFAANVKKIKELRSPTELHREMFSKAAARLAQIHTKQKQQEVERQNRELADADLRLLERENECKAALNRLNQLFENRTPRLRQIDQWDHVVRAWDRLTKDKAVEQTHLREEAAKQLQDELRDEKFGDINLFIALAGEDSKPVWWHEGKLNSSILRTYIKGKKARSDAERLKVASYRHPDPFHNPVFCQFGVSRPHIEFGRLSAIKSKNEAANDIRAVELLLWDGRQSAHHILFGASKRFDREIGSTFDTAAENLVTLPIVSRRSRLGMSKLDKRDGQKARAAAVFDQKQVNQRKSGDGDDEDEIETKEASWNGTLQPDRKVLAAIAKLVESNSYEKAAQRLRRLHWSLIVSLGLQPIGRWPIFAADHPQTISLGETLSLAPKKTKDTWRGTAYPFIHLHNSDRPGTMSYHVLSRLPGLRLLSVDLGHRFAAACAVWETITHAEIIDACHAANHPGPSRNDLFIHLRRETAKLQKSGKRKGQRIVETVVYRRIGDDTLPDGTEHPAPWARLDRQFLIKLQGEEKPARWASNKERDEVNELAQEVGYQRPKPRRARDRRVDELMSEAVRIVRLALRRHGDYARIAFGLSTTRKQLPGGRVADQQMSREDTVDLMQNLLMLWYDLSHSKEWNDAWATQQWQNHIAELSGYSEPSQPVEDTTGPQRRKYREQLRETFRPIAEVLADRDRSRLAGEWRAQWNRSDAEWKPRLKWLRNWILPRKLCKPRDKKGRLIEETDEEYLARKGRRAAARNVGGLSLTRIATIRSLWQVYKAYRYQPRPEDTRVGIALIEKDSQDKRKFGDRMLQTMEHMREQRVKQLASRIVEAALGIGSENKWKHWEKGSKRPQSRIAEKRFEPCHAVVIENLTNYRPEETRTRRENRQLMSWSSSKVKKYLSEGCQLHGLHLREVSAAYTSRQDSRTGLPGIRCVDVPEYEFRTTRHWRTRVRQAASKNDVESRFLVDVNLQADTNRVLRLPLKSGDLFVSVDGRTLQADLNAAANIGLRALLDPDWPGKWWYVPCRTDTGKPVADKVKGSRVMDSDLPLATITSGKAKKEKDVTNQWRDCSCDPLQLNQFKPYDAYWNWVRCRVVDSLRKTNGMELVEERVSV